MYLDLEFSESEKMLKEINRLKDEVELLAEGSDEKQSKEELIKYKIKEFKDFSEQSRSQLVKERNNLWKEIFEEI